MRPVVTKANNNNVAAAVLKITTVLIFITKVELWNHHLGNSTNPRLCYLDLSNLVSVPTIGLDCYCVLCLCSYCCHLHRCLCVGQSAVLDFYKYSSQTAFQFNDSLVRYGCAHIPNIAK